MNDLPAKRDFAALSVQAQDLRHALIVALTTKEVIRVAEKAFLLQAAAKLAKESDAAQDAAEIRKRAERLLGQMMAMQERAEVGRPKKGSEKPILPEIGIDKNLANRAREAAASSESAFEKLIADIRRAVGRSFNKVISVAETKKRRAKKKATAGRIRTKRTFLVKEVAEVGEADLPSYAVQAIITDPPYGEKALSVYCDLGRFAMRVLKPGGWCVVLTGTMYLDRIIDDLRGCGLTYRWLLPVRFPGGPTPRIGALRLYQSWKPVLIFQVPPLRAPPGQEWYRDEIEVKVSDFDKSGHAWQQPLKLFSALVERFTEPEDLVADPFAGTGTTLDAAEALGRHAWGADDGSADHLRKD